MRTAVFILLSAVALQGCSSEYVAERTADAVIFTGKTVGRAAIGAGKMVVRGASAGYTRLSEPVEDLPAGTILCTDADGVVYGIGEERDGRVYCPANV